MRTKFEARSFTRSKNKNKKIGSPWIHPRSLFSESFNWLLFGWTLRMYWPNLKSVPLPVPEIIGVPINLDSPLICPHAIFSKIFDGLLFGWTLLLFWPNTKSEGVGLIVRAISLNGIFDDVRHDVIFR